MYVRNTIRAYNGLGQNEFNPPFWYQQMATDPTQVPAWTYYGPPPPGYYYGQRTYSQTDAIRDAQRRQAQMELRAETSDQPEDKYIAPQGKLNPVAHQAMMQARAAQAAAPQADLSVEKRVIGSVILGAALSALLR